MELASGLEPQTFVQPRISTGNRSQRGVQEKSMVPLFEWAFLLHVSRVMAPFQFGDRAG